MILKWQAVARWKWAGFLLLLLGFVALNILAVFHARSLTRFAPAGSVARTNGVATVFFGARIPKPLNHRSPTDEGLSFETLFLPGAGGAQLEVWRIPVENSKGRVLCFHGHAAAKDQLLSAGREFHGMGFEAWLVDFHGSGGSTGNTTTIGWDEAQDVASVFRSAHERLPALRVVLYGGSMGAVAILRAVAEFGVLPDRLILECPFDRLSNTVANRIRNHGAPAFPLTQLLLFWGGVQNGFDAFAHNPETYARQVHAPTLILQGDRDRTISMDESRSILKGLGTNGVLVAFQGVGHVPLVQAKPEEWRVQVSVMMKGL